MDNQRFFKDRHIIAALVISIIGIVCMRVGGEVVKNIGSVLLVSGVYTVFDSLDDLDHLIGKKYPLVIKYPFPVPVVSNCCLPSLSNVLLGTFSIIIFL